MKSVIITGSEGYIGENLQQYLMNKGIYKIHCYDKLSGGNIENLEILPQADFIIHLAAISGIQNCQDNPSQAIIDNISASFNILKLAYKQKIPVFFASSQAAKDPNSSLYAMTKFTVETELLRYNSLGMKNKIMRFANVYGGYKYLEKKTSVVSNFLNNKMNGLPLEIHGNGEQKRDFLYVNDLCQTVYELMNKNHMIKEDIIDIGTGEMLSINELANMINNDIEYKEDRSCGCDSNFADISVLTNHNVHIPNMLNLKVYINNNDEI